MKKTDRISQKHSAYVFMKLLGLEEAITVINSFYDRLPKMLCFRKPSFAKLLEIAFSRITYVIMNSRNVKQRKYTLPIEDDSAGYFFPTVELQNFRKDPSGDRLSGADRDSALNSLILMVNRGLDSFKEFPIYHYLEALAFASDAEGTFKHEIKGIAEVFPLLAKQSQTREMYTRQGRGKDVIEDVAEYEKTILPQMRAAALALHSLYFDLTNLFLGAFMNRHIGRIIREALEEMSYGAQPMSFFLALRIPRVYSILKKEKVDYLESKRVHIKNRLYVPLALWVYRQRIVLDSDIAGEGFKYLSNLKSIEFLDYNASEDYSGYVQCIKCKKDLRSVFYPAIQEISKKTNSSEAVARYLEIFQLPENRKGHFIQIFVSKRFVRLWSYAYFTGWGEELAVSVFDAADIFSDTNIIDILLRQDSGKLVVMLRHPDFRDHLKKIDVEQSDFEFLYEIFWRDKALFEQAYPYIATPDRKFIQSLVRLIKSGNYNTSGIILTDKLKKFVESLGNYDTEDTERIIYVLQHFQRLQRAVLCGYIPFSGNLEDMDDKAALSTWVFKNKEIVSKKVALAEAVLPYLDNLEKHQLREALIKLLQKHGDEFCSKYLEELKLFGESRHLEEHAYLRIVDILIPLTYASRLCRKREILGVLQYMASTTTDSEWETFFLKFTRIDGSTLSAYDELFKEYHADLILKNMGSKGDMRETKLIVEVYSSAKSMEQKSLIDQLSGVLVEIVVPLDVVGAICSYIAKCHYRVAEFGITRLKEGELPEEVLKIMEENMGSGLES